MLAERGKVIIKLEVDITRDHTDILSLESIAKSVTKNYSQVVINHVVDVKVIEATLVDNDNIMSHIDCNK